MSSSKKKLLEERYGARSASGEGTKKKNRRKKREYRSNGGSNVVDVDVELGVRPEVKDELEDEDEDAPAVATVEDENITHGGPEVSNWVTVKAEERDTLATPVEEDGLSPTRHRRHNSPDASPPRRRRHDSSPDATPPRRSRHDSPDRHRRHDSTDASPPRRQRHDSSPDASPPRRSRHDSPDMSPPRRRQRHDSSPDASPPRRSRHDSPDMSPPRRHRHEDPGRKISRYDDEVVRRKPTTEDRTASGYKAGLQSSDDFKQVEEEIQASHRAELAGMEESGLNAETVYRDRKGRKLDMLNEFMRQKGTAEGKAKAEASAAYEWGTGQVQKDEAQRHARNMANIASQPFSRTIEDLDAEKRKEILEDDPMVGYMRKKIAKETGRPVMMKRGPPPNPNRFGITPGYRWDGRDRSNGFEQKCVDAANKRNDRSYRAHMAATADM